MGKQYDYESRLIIFAGEVIKFTKTLRKSYEFEYLGNQVIRSACSAALNFGESQGTWTTRDYIHKASISLKELKESQVNLRIIEYLENADLKLGRLLEENVELIKILRTIIRNKSIK